MNTRTATEIAATAELDIWSDSRFVPKTRSKLQESTLLRAQLGQQPKSKTLVFSDKARLRPVVCLHSLNNLERDAHAHVLQIAIVAHDIFEHLVPGCPAAGTHPVWCNSIRQPPRRNDFEAIAVDGQFNVCAG